MVKWVPVKGIRADYIVMNSWFCFPALLARIGMHLQVICMAKNMHKVFYYYQGKWRALSSLCKQF